MRKPKDSLYLQEQPLTCSQISETCLVTGRRMVRATSELESKHGGHWSGHCGHYSHGVERERGQGTQDKDARARTILPESIVRLPDRRRKEYGCHRVIY